MRGTAVSFVILLLCIASLALPCLGCGGGEPEPYGPTQVHFPEDEGAHPDFGVEWWYLNSTLRGADGREYTAMVAYFRPALRIISISDLESRAFYQDSTAPELAMTYAPDYAEGCLDLNWQDSDRWCRSDPDSLSYQLEARGADIGLSFDLTSEKPHLPVGGDGLVEWTEGSTYYYSLTRLQVEGWIEMANETMEVEGIGWMDHQWMESMSSRGWDWFSVQLDNDAEIILWRIVNPDESVDSLDMTIMFPDASVYHTGDIVLEPLDSWASPATGNEYGTLWRVRDGARGLDLEIEARYPDQEIELFPDHPEIDFDFWEGSTIVSGELDGEAVFGTGYAELVRPPTMPSMSGDEAS